MAYPGWDFLESRSACAHCAFVCCIVHIGISLAKKGFESLDYRLIAITLWQSLYDSLPRSSKSE